MGDHYSIEFKTSFKLVLLDFYFSNATFISINISSILTIHYITFLYCFDSVYIYIYIVHFLYLKFPTKILFDISKTNNIRILESILSPLPVNISYIPNIPKINQLLNYRTTLHVK